MTDPAFPPLAPFGVPSRRGGRADGSFDFVPRRRPAPTGGGGGGAPRAPAPPPAAYAVPGAGEIDVYWHSSQWGGPTAYKVYRHTSDTFGSATLVHTETGSSRRYTDTGRTNGTPYYYWVVATNAAGDSARTQAQLYPNDGSTVAVAPSANYAGAPLLPFDEWWDLGEASDGSAQVDRQGAFPAQVDPTSTWRLTLTDNGSSKVPSASLPGGGTGADVGAANRQLSAVGQMVLVNARLAHEADSFGLACRFYLTSLGTSDRYLFSQLCTHGATNSLAGPNVYINTSNQLRIDSARRRSTTVDSVTLTSPTIQAGRWYTAVGGYDAQQDKVYLVLVEDNGAVHRAESSAGVGARLYWKYGYLDVGNRQAGNVLPGYIDWAAYVKGHPVTNSEAQWLANAGATRTVASVRPRPAADPGPAPFAHLLESADWDTALRLTGSGLGMFWMRPFPLHQWDAGLAASRGRYLWAWSTDHTTGGVRLGYSDDRAVAPAEFTTVVSSGTHTSGTRSVSGVETPHLWYVAGDANGRPFYMAVHGPVTSSAGQYAGFNSPQETWLFTAADPNGPWTCEGPLVPVELVGSTGFDHTGYAVVFAPQELPGTAAGDYHCYHGTGQTAPASEQTVSISTDPKAFDADQDFQGIDESSFAGPGYSRLFAGNALLVAGGKLYSVTPANGPPGRGLYCYELALENGRLRKPSGGVWAFGSRATGAYPTTGYQQSAKGSVEDGVATVYRVRGYPDAVNNGPPYDASAPADSPVDYLQAVFDATAAAAHRPLGVAVAVNGSARPVVTCHEVLPGTTYRLYRKPEGGAYSLLGTLTASNGVYSYTDTSAVAGTRYVYQVRTVNGGSEVAGAEVRATPAAVTATPAPGAVTVDWPDLANGGTYRVYKRAGAAPKRQAYYRHSPDPSGSSLTHANGADTSYWHYLVVEVVSGVESVVGAAEAQAQAALPLYTYVPGDAITSLTRTTVAAYQDNTGAWQSAASGALRDSHYQLNPNTALRERTTLLENQRTNQFLNSTAPVAQSRSLANGTWACSLFGSGSVAVSGASTGNGTATEGAPVFFTVSGGPLSVTFTVGGTVANVSVEAVNTANDGWSSPTVTAGSAVTRNVDDFRDAWGSSLPQSMTAYVRFFDMSRNTGGTLFALGSNTAPFFRLSKANSTGYSATHQNTVSRVASATVSAPAWGALVEVRGVLNADGSVTVGVSVNGGSETTNANANAQAFAANWSDAVVRLGTANGASLPGVFAFTHVRVEAGVKTMAEMRTAAGVA